jgi:hypothetical protein
MTRPSTESPKPATPDSLIDEMIDESFPASDPPQLAGRAHGEAAVPPETAPRDAREQIAKGSPPGIGNQGAIPASGVLEETVNVSDEGAVHLRFDGDFRHLHVYLGEEGMGLDAQSLDKLIAVLSQKRARMIE